MGPAGNKTPNVDAVVSSSTFTVVVTRKLLQTTNQTPREPIGSSGDGQAAVQVVREGGARDGGRDASGGAVKALEFLQTPFETLRHSPGIP